MDEALDSALIEFDPFSPAPDPFRVQAELLKRCPVRAVGEGAVLVMGMDAVMTVLRDGVTFSNRSPRPDFHGEVRALIHLDGEEHAEKRRLINKAFTPRSVTELAPRIQATAHQLVNAFCADGAADLVRAYCGPLPQIVMLDVLGIPVGDREKFLHWADDAIRHSYGNTPPPSGPEFRRFVLERIEERRRDPADEFISRLVQAEEEGAKLTEAELVAMVRILIVAGTETTANLLATLFHQLLLEHTRWEAVRGDRALVARAVEEALRIDSPLNWIPRVVAQQAELGGESLPEGTVVLTGLGSANRDPTAFSDPDSFRLDRPGTAAHVGFGYGAHFCIGAPLARLEAAIGLSTLLDRLPDLELDAGYEFRPRGPLMMRGCECLPVHFEPTTTRGVP